MRIDQSGVSTPVVTFLLLVLAIASLGSLIFRQQETELKARVHNELRAVADLKSEQIVRWRQERQGNAQAASQDCFLASAVAQWFREGPAEGELRQRLLGRLTVLQEAYDYRDVYLLDQQATLRLSTAATPPTVSLAARTLALEAMRTGKILLSDFFRSEAEPGQPIRLGVFAPLLDSNRQAIGVLFFRIDPDRFLFPLIQSWPSPSATAETVLVERAGNEVLYLNEPRHEKGTALNLRFPATEEQLPTAMAVRGFEGLTEGNDYRGVPVLAAVRRIPESPWFLIAEVDRQEVYAPVRERLLLLAASTFASIAFAGLLTALWWRQQRTGFLLRESRDRLERQALVEHFDYLTKFANDIILLCDEDFRLVEVNDRALEAFGCARAEMLGRHLTEFYAAEAVDDFKLHSRQLLANKSLVFEALAQRKDKTVFPVENSARVIEIDGETFYQGILRDITERKQAEQQLRQSEAELKEAQRIAHLGSWELDARTNEVRWSEELARIYGGPPHEESVLLSAIVEAIPPPDRARVAATIRESYDTHAPFNLEHRIARPDGSQRWVHSRGEVVVDETGKAVRIVGTALDITDRKQTEATATRLAAVVEQAGDAIVITDPDGTIVYVNPFFERQSGYSAVEAVGQSPRILKSGHHDEPFYRNLWETLSAGRMWNGHLVNRRKDGTLYHEDATLFPIQDAEGHILNYAGVKKDVTQHMEAEAKIRKLARLYATLSQTNEIIVRVTNREDLFRDICRAAVEHGQFALAWIGRVDQRTRRVEPVCHFGEAQEYLRGIRISIDDVPEGRGPTGTAIREDQVVYVNDYATDERVLMWREQALRSGFRSAAALPLRVGGQVIGALSFYVAETDFFDPGQIRLLEEMAMDISFALEGFLREARRQQAEVERGSALRQVRETLEKTVRMAASTVEMRDPYTAGHQRRVSQLAAAIARELNLSEFQIEGIHFGAIIHDIGKLYVPAEILSMPRKLSPLQIDLIRAHAQMGCDIVKQVDFPWPVAQMILQHHERLDGSGYPNGLKGDAIIREARILAVADVVEAMSSHRPYRPSLGLDAALAEIEHGRGILFDPDAVDACLQLFREKQFHFDE